MKDKPTLPCIGCQYLSEEKDACMFYSCMDVPLAEPILFVDEFYNDAEPEYPETCIMLEEVQEELEEHMDNVDEILKELSNEWKRIAVAREWVRLLEAETAAGLIKGEKGF